MENREATRAVARKGLEAVRAALASCSTRHLRYLCGDSLTYADIVVAESIYFDPERYGKFGYVYSDEQFFDEFTDVVAWARAVRSTHYASLVASRKAGS